MTLVVAVLAATLLPPGSTQASVPERGGPGQGPSGVALTRLPVRFEANRGQTDRAVRFVARGAGYSLFLTPSEFVLRQAAGNPAAVAAGTPGSGPAGENVLRFRPVGANPEPRVVGAGQLPGRANYLVGADRSKWTRGVPGYAKVRYRSLYPGIDMVFHGTGGKLEYDFVVRPGADPGLIGLAVTGAGSMDVDSRGDLVIQTPAGPVRQAKPVLYQVVGDRKRAVEGGYVVGPSGHLGFRVGAYDAARTLVIDPVLAFSTFLGGAEDDGGHGVAVDGAGNVYVTGWTGSSDFPAPADSANGKFAGTGLSVLCSHVGRGGALAGGGSSVFGQVRQLQGGGGCGDAFVVKLDPSGSRLVYSTYLGGDAADAGVGIAVDPSGHAHVTGFTFSGQFPTKGAFQPRIGAVGIPDAFLVKLSPGGADLVYSTFLGGTGLDSGNAVALDSSGKAYVAGAAGVGFPTKAGVQPAVGGPSADAFVAKLDPGLTGPDSLVYSTFLGGSQHDQANGIAVDRSGSAYVTGLAGDGFPTKGAVQAKFAGPACGGVINPCADAFVAKLNPAGSALVYSTYLGTETGDAGTGIAVDSSGNAHLTGTAGPGLPTRNGAYKTAKGPTDAFLVKLDASGSRILYASYVGGTGNDAGNAVALDASGNAHIVGTSVPESSTTPTKFPVKNALQRAKGGGGDAFIASFQPGRSGAASLTFASPFGGGAADDAGNGIAVDDSGIYVTGSTLSFSDFPIGVNAIQPVGKGDTDAFVAKVSPERAGTPTITEVTPRSGPPAGGTTVLVSGTNLDKVSAVNFGSALASEYRVSADGRRMAVRAPAHDPGPVVLAVTTKAGLEASAPGTGFTFGPGVWTRTAVPKVARSWPTAVRLGDGRVLLAGGCVKRQRRNDECVQATATAEIYDPATGRWAPTGAMTTPRHSQAAAALLGDGRVLMVGGFGAEGNQVLGSAEVYDPKAGTWSATPDPGFTLVADQSASQGVQAISATALSNGKVLVAGQGGAALYDPATGTWGPTGDKPLPLALDHTATLLADGRVLVVGTSTALYDPATGRWLATPEIPISRINKTATLLGDGKVLVAAGRASLLPSDYLSSSETYDPKAPNPSPPTTGEWSAARSLAVGRYGHAATSLLDGKVLVVGGTYAHGGRLDSAEVYDPASDQWVPAGVTAEPHGRGVTATLLEDGTVLVVGSGGSADLYDPVATLKRAALGIPGGGDSGGSDGGDIGEQRWALPAVAALLAVVIVAIVALVTRRRRRRHRAQTALWP